jgi:hypothetical protein
MIRIRDNLWNKEGGLVALMCERGGKRISSVNQNTDPMKIIRKTKDGERREALLKEYFITASMIALLKRVGQEAAKAAPRRTKTAALAKVRH